MTQTKQKVKKNSLIYIGYILALIVVTGISGLGMYYWYDSFPEKYRIFVAGGYGGLIGWLIAKVTKE